MCVYHACLHCLIVGQVKLDNCWANIWQYFCNGQINQIRRSPIWTLVWYSVQHQIFSHSERLIQDWCPCVMCKDCWGLLCITEYMICSRVMISFHKLISFCRHDTYKMYILEWIRRKNLPWNSAAVLLPENRDLIQCFYCIAFYSESFLWLWLFLQQSRHLLLCSYYRTDTFYLRVMTSPWGAHLSLIAEFLLWNILRSSSHRWTNIFYSEQCYRSVSVQL